MDLRICIEIFVKFFCLFTLMNSQYYKLEQLKKKRGLGGTAVAGPTYFLLHTLKPAVEVLML